MVRIPGATFPMGTDAAKIPEIAAAFNISKHPDLIQAETPQHNVTIAGFYLDQFEVTNAAFRRFIRARPEWSVARIPSALHNGNYLKDWNGDNFPKGKANHPVANVSWYAAAAFCQWLGKRLPTEAEWEFAARGGMKDKTFPWGDEPVDPSRANYGGSKLGGTSPVGSYPPNGYGLFDMAGNVWEFTADEWAPYPGTPGSAGILPAGWSTGSARILRAIWNSGSAGILPAIWNSGSAGIPPASFFLSPWERSEVRVRSMWSAPASTALWIDSSPQDFLQVKTRRVIRGGSFAGAPLNLRVTYRDSHPPDGAQPFVGFRCAK